MKSLAILLLSLLTLTLAIAAISTEAWGDGFFPAAAEPNPLARGCSVQITWVMDQPESAAASISFPDRCSEQKIMATAAALNAMLNPQ